MKIALFFLAFVPLFLYEGHGCGRFKKKDSIVCHTLSSSLPQSPNTNAIIENIKSEEEHNSKDSNPSTVFDSDMSPKDTEDAQRTSQSREQLDISDIPEASDEEKPTQQVESPATPESESDKPEQHHEFNVPKIKIETASDEEAEDEAEFRLYGDKDGIGGGEIKMFFSFEKHVETKCTNLHKNKRKEGLVDLTWSPALAKFAAKNAAKCHESSLHYLHRDMKDVSTGFSVIGENRYFSSALVTLLSDAIYAWSDDEDESLAKFGFAMAQLLSTTVTHVGCGKARCPEPNPKPASGLTDIQPDKNLLQATDTGKMRKDKKREWKEDRIYCEYAPGFEPDKERELAKPWSSKAPPGWKA